MAYTKYIQQVVHRDRADGHESVMKNDLKNRDLYHGVTDNKQGITMLYHKYLSSHLSMKTLIQLQMHMYTQLSIIVNHKILKCIK